MFSRQFGVVLGFAYAVFGVSFNGPTVTPVADRFDANGWTPKPTSRPRPLMELRKRQDDEDPGFCGYLEGDPDEPILCSIGACMYDDTFSWFGCCTGTVVEDCYVQTACVESSSIGDCLDNADCLLDPLATICSARNLPHCAFLYTVISGQSYGHYECAPSQTTWEVVSTASDSGDVEFSTTDLSGIFDPPSFTLDTSSVRPSRSARTTSTDDDEDDTSTAESSQTRSGDGTSVSPETTTAESPSSATPVDVQTSVVTTGAAMRTAEAVLGAAGGVAGLLAIFA